MKTATLVAILISGALSNSPGEENSPQCLSAPAFNINQQYNGGQYVKYGGVCYQAKYWINPGQFIPTLYDADNAWQPCTTRGTSCDKADFWDAANTYQAGTYVNSQFKCCFKNSYYSKGEDPLLFTGPWIMVNPDDPNCKHTHTCQNAPVWVWGKNWQPNEHVCWNAKCWRMIDDSPMCERPDWRPEMWQYVEESNLCPIDADACLNPLDYKRPDQWDQYTHYDVTYSVWYGGCCFNKKSGSAADPVPDYPTGPNWIQYDPYCQLMWVSQQVASDWQSDISYPQGSFVKFDTCIYTNQWYSLNESPGDKNMWGPWDKVDPVCKEDLDCSDQYKGATVYQVGDLVCRNHQCWRALQRSCDRIPEISPDDWSVDDKFHC